MKLRRPPTEPATPESDCPEAPLSRADPPVTPVEEKPAIHSTSQTARVDIHIELPVGSSVRLAVEALPEDSPTQETAGSQAGVIIYQRDGNVRVRVLKAVSAATAYPRAQRSWRLAEALRLIQNHLTEILFGLSLLIYLASRLTGLTDFPIYFFTDEAVQTVMAADFMRDGLRNYDGELLPTYFSNGPTFNLSSVSVYLQVIPYLLFGKSVFVTRAVSVLVTTLAGLWVGLILKDIFKVRYWWAGTLLLSIAPAWFLHSRTAFETAEMVSFYTGFLYCYLLYRHRSPAYLYPALVLGALAFYTYSPGQVIVAVTGVLLLISDLKYHWQQRGTALLGLLLLGVLALPYLRFALSHPVATIDQLAARAPFWVQPIPLSEKLERFSGEYLYGLRPDYWFLPNDRDLSRHLMKGYGHLLLGTLPFTMLGLAMALWRWRDPAYRAILAALLAAPSGSALVEIGITRVLVLVIPVTVLAALGLSEALSWLESPARRFAELKAIEPLKAFAPKIRFPNIAVKWQLPYPVIAIGVFVILSGYNTWMLRDSLTNGPTWYREYDLAGLQYGGRQIFTAVQEYLEGSPQTRILLSPSWANGTDVIARFFLNDPLPIQMGSIEGHMAARRPVDEDTLFVMIPHEYEKAMSSGKFTNVRLERTLPYPDGTPGFYFVRLEYVENIDQILAAEKAERLQLREVTLVIEGMETHLRYSYLDMGDIRLLFDSDEYSVARTYEANPFVIELAFAEARQVSAIDVIVGSIEAKFTARISPSLDGPFKEFSITQRGTVEQPKITLSLGEPVIGQKITLLVDDLHQEEPAHVHVWEVVIR